MHEVKWEIIALNEVWDICRNILFTGACWTKTWGLLSPVRIAPLAHETEKLLD